MPELEVSQVVEYIWEIHDSSWTLRPFDTVLLLTYVSSVQNDIVYKGFKSISGLFNHQYLSHGEIATNGVVDGLARRYIRIPFQGQVEHPIHVQPGGQTSWMTEMYS